jgi:hypothetical protein
MRELNVLFDNGAGFVDYSLDLQSYVKDQVEIVYDADTNCFLLGLYKPFGEVFVDLPEPSTLDNTLRASYSTTNGIYKSLVIKDDTKSFKRSGFILWDRELSDWQPLMINGISAYWVKLELDMDTSFTLNGINIVYSDDYDLKSVLSDVDKFLKKEQVSFVQYHQAARDEMIQALRNSGYTKKNANDEVRDITKWDILDFSQLREASKYKTLSLIMFEASRETDDKYYQRARDYEGTYAMAFKNYLLAIDKNDDGKKDETEASMIRSVRVIKG